MTKQIGYLNAITGVEFQEISPIGTSVVLTSELSPFQAAAWLTFFAQHSIAFKYKEGPQSATLWIKTSNLQKHAATSTLKILSQRTFVLALDETIADANEALMETYRTQKQTSQNIQKPTLQTPWNVVEQPQQAQER